MTIERADLKELDVLKMLLEDSTVSQAAIAKTLGVAVGSVNGQIKRFVDENLLTVQPCGGRKFQYNVTALGVDRYNELLSHYMSSVFGGYRTIKSQMQSILIQCAAQGFEEVVIFGDGDAAEIAALIAMSLGMTPSIIKDALLYDPALPLVTIQYLTLGLHLPQVATKNEEKKNHD